VAARFFISRPSAGRIGARGVGGELVGVMSLKTGEITAEKLSSLKNIWVYVTGQKAG